VIFAPFPVAAVASFLVSSGKFLVQQTYVESLPETFCCVSNFVSFYHNWIVAGMRVE